MRSRSSWKPRSLVTSFACLLAAVLGIGYSLAWYHEQMVVEHLARELKNLPEEELPLACRQLIGAGPLGVKAVVESLDGEEIRVAHAAEAALRDAISSPALAEGQQPGPAALIARRMAEKIDRFGVDAKERAIRLAREILWVGSAEDRADVNGSSLIELIEDCRTILAWASVPNHPGRSLGSTEPSAAGAELAGYAEFGGRRRQVDAAEFSSRMPSAVVQAAFEDASSGNPIDLPTVVLDPPTLPPPAPGWQEMARRQVAAVRMADDGSGRDAFRSDTSKDDRETGESTQRERAAGPNAAPQTRAANTPRQLAGVDRFLPLPLGSRADGNRSARLASEPDIGDDFPTQGEPQDASVKASDGSLAERRPRAADYAGIPLEPPPLALFEQLHDPDEGVVLEAERQLTESGYRESELALAKDLVDDRPAVRMSVIDRLATIPRIDVRRWLVWLSRDGDADVRLAALTVMATSSDPLLLRVLETAAPGDADPRVARLARKRMGQAK